MHSALLRLLSRTRRTKAKFNFQTKNKTRLCNSKTRTQNVQDKHENEFLLY
jgi:hypothetical protein